MLSAISGQSPAPRARGDWRKFSAASLPVVFQHLIATRGQLGTVLLQAGENGEIALIDYGTTVALHVAGAGLLFIGRPAARLLLGDGIRRNRGRQQEKSQESFTHRIPSFSTGDNPVPEVRFGMAGEGLWGLKTLRSAATNGGQAPLNAAKFAAL